MSRAMLMVSRCFAALKWKMEKPLGGRRGLGWLLMSGGSILPVAFGGLPAYAADFSITPMLTVSEEYTDNVNDSDTDEKTDFITRALPGVAMVYKAPFWDWSLDYAFDYRYYAKGTRKDDNTHSGSLSTLLKLVDEKLFLQASDTYQRVSLDVTRDVTAETLYANQSDQNVATVSPYLVLRPVEALTVRTSYRYINTWYKNAGAVSKQNHVGAVDVTYDVGPRLSTTAGYSYSREEGEDSATSLTSQTAYVGPRYEYADKSVIFATGGVLLSRYNGGGHASNPYWNAGLTHSFDTMTLNLLSSVSYSENPQGAATLTTSYTGSLARVFKRGSCSVSGGYTEFSEADSDTVQTKRYSAGFATTYELTEDLHGTLGISYEHYDDVLAEAITKRYMVDSGLSYQLAKQTSLGVTYRFVDYTSDSPSGDNRVVNRVVVTMQKSF